MAVGKSTTSRLLQELLSRGPGHPQVDLVTTDGFLHPNAALESMGLLQRKGFPESYDRRALVKFVMDVKSGEPEVTAPVYSHLGYDIVPGERITIRQPDILIVEGLNVLQPARRRADGTTGLAVSDFFDFSVYVDAADENVRNWYIARFLPAPGDRLPESEVLFRPLRPDVRGGGVPDRRAHLGHREWPEPRPQHPADPRPGHRHPPQEREPPGELGAHPQGVGPALPCPCGHQPPWPVGRRRSRLACGTRSA